jgi:P4 family phage/plasmid primase-like protien
MPANMNVLAIKNREELDFCLKSYLDNIPIDKYNYCEAYEYTMTLPASYYDSGSYSKWFAVGCALRNISNCLFIVWLAFSAQAANFDFRTIHELWDKWQKLDSRNNGLTLRSIMFWSKRDAPEKYNAVRENSLDYYIEQTLDNRLSEFAISDKKPSGATDYDIASVLYHLKKDKFVCTSISGNIWFQYDKHRWKQIDSGSTLRMAISTELRNLYAKKAAKISEAISNLSEDEDKTREYLGKRLEKVMEIYAKLGKTNDKKNLMTECKDMFYDANFANTIDTNPYLLCCSNGVWDFKEKIFRDGKPEDYISKCCNIDYIPIGPEHTGIVAEINDFMEKLFPIPELKEYMWDHLSSTLIGTAVNQTFNNYIGGGRNGKSVLVTLMSKTLGEYKGDLPLTAVVTQRRVGVGGLAPEIAALKGIRYAVMQEPKQGDVLNEGILKELTSGFDTIQARIPYQQEPLRFIPQFKLIVCANVLPEIKAQDHGTWRRIRVAPFMSLFTENPVQGDEYKPYQYKLDPTIDEKFETWKTVLLAMMVERVLKTGGRVQDCETVLKASNDYKHKQDVISQFIEEKIVREQGCGILKKTDVKNEFQIWHETNFSSRGPPPKEVYAYLDRLYGPQVQNGWRDVKIQRDELNDAFIDDDDIDL